MSHRRLVPAAVFGGAVALLPLADALLASGSGAPWWEWALGVVAFVVPTAALGAAAGPSVLDADRPQRAALIGALVAAAGVGVFVAVGLGVAAAVSPSADVPATVRDDLGAMVRDLVLATALGAAAGWALHAWARLDDAAD